MGFYGICFARGGWGGDECLVMSGMKGKATVRTGTRNRGVEWRSLDWSYAGLVPSGSESNLRAEKIVQGLRNTEEA